MNRTSEPDGVHPHLINNPERQSTSRRTVFGVLTAIAWVVYAYLWLPLVTLLVWWLGIKTTYVELYLREQRIDTFLLLVVPLIMVFAGIVLVGWAEYNRNRFQDQQDRREPMPDVTHAEIAANMGAALSLANALQQARYGSVAMNEAAVPVMLTADSNVASWPPADLVRPGSVSAASAVIDASGPGALSIVPSAAGPG